MKKILALILTLSLAVCALALPALAEETAGTADQVSSATQNSQTGRGGRDPMPGHGRNGQMPQMPGQTDQGTQNSQNGQNSQQSQLPGQNGRGTKRGNRFGSQSTDGTSVRTGKFGKHLDFDQLLKDGVITQEVYDAIMAYMKEHALQKADTAAPAEETAPAEGTVPPALPDGTAPAEGTEPPALPDGTAPADGTEPPALPDGAQGEPEAMEEQLLKELLDSGVITQEQYDLLLTKISTVQAASET